jgi:serine/threonine protein kinase
VFPQDKTQSAWPEYAVKIIQASKIAELGYKSSVIREMAVLQLLSHPGVSRLVSAFRYSDSAYMVLEYAARGDLHTYLTKHGKLAHKYCRYAVSNIPCNV